MEQLKKLLRLALGGQAVSLNLTSGREPELILSQGRKLLSAEPRITDERLLALKNQLFGNSPLMNKTGLLTGFLTIANVGRIQLILQSHSPQSLSLYLPPMGQAAFERDWELLNAAPPALLREETLNSPGLAAPPPNDPEEDILSTAGFIPPILGAGSAAAVTPIKASLSFSIKTNAQDEHITPQGNNLLKIPVESYEPEEEPVTKQQVKSDSKSTPEDHNTGEIKLNFGPSSVGDAGISDGHNPIDKILTDLVKRKGSDLHMTCGEPICFRVDGEITRVSQNPSTPEDMESYLAPIIPARNLAELKQINDTDFAYEIRGVGRFRVNIFRDKNGIGSVMRHIPSTILTAEQLNLPPAITKFCNLTKGLVVVTGPTGSGKSTTLAAMVDLINKTRHDHILTIEDPIEFVHPQQKCLVNQREVHKHTGSFSRALKAALREDPDIVLIGEMRDLETVAIAIETAETGHLVFGTLHTNTAVSTIDRIVDQFPTDRQEQIRMMLSSSLKGVIAQTLLKKKGGGRVAAHEILVSSDAIAAMIREGKNHMIPNHMQTQKQDGNILLNESLFKLVKDGIVDVDDAMRKAVDKNSLQEMFKRAGIAISSGPSTSGVLAQEQAAQASRIKT